MALAPYVYALYELMHVFAHSRHIYVYITYFTIDFIKF